VLDLSRPELEVLLWGIDTIDHAYSNRPPQQTMVHSLREKAQLELLRHEAKALQPTTVEVVREGKGW
jgi:hypothetical protein